MVLDCFNTGSVGWAKLVRSLMAEPCVWGKETFDFDPAHNLIDEAEQKVNTQRRT